MLLDATLSGFTIYLGTGVLFLLALVLVEVAVIFRDPSRAPELIRLQEKHAGEALRLWPWALVFVKLVLTWPRLIPITLKAVRCGRTLWEHCLTEMEERDQLIRALDHWCCEHEELLERTRRALVEEAQEEVQAPNNRSPGHG